MSYCWCCGEDTNEGCNEGHPFGLYNLHICKACGTKVEEVLSPKVGEMVEEVARGMRRSWLESELGKLR